VYEITHLPSITISMIYFEFTDFSKICNDINFVTHTKITITAIAAINCKIMRFGQYAIAVPVGDSEECICPSILDIVNKHTTITATETMDVVMHLRLLSATIIRILDFSFADSSLSSFDVLMLWFIYFI